MRRGIPALVCFCSALLSLGASPQSAWAETEELASADPTAPPHLELQLSTGTAAFGGLNAIESAPGVLYLVSNNLLIVHLAAGAGAVFGDWVVGGRGTALVNAFVGNVEIPTRFALQASPYFRWAPGLAERDSGFFLEPYLSFGAVGNEDSDLLFVFNAGLWSGYQLFATDEAALVLGAYAEYIKIDGNHEVGVGLRFGVNVYPP